MTRCAIACRVLPDRAGRPRVIYLTGWAMMSGPTWARDVRAPEVLHGTERDAARWIEELRRDGIDGAQVVTEEG